MPFAATTRDRVMGALQLPLTRYYVEIVEQHLDEAATYGGDEAVTRIEGYLTQYETQDTALNAEAQNAGLIQADVLRWQVGGKTSGIKSELVRLRGQIARSLLLESLVRGTGVRLVRND